MPFSSLPEGISIVKEEGLSGFLHRPGTDGSSGDALVLTHGAGSNCQSPLLTTLASAFCATGFTVFRYDLPFRQLRPHGPPIRSAEKDQQGIAQAVAWIGSRVPGRLFAGGHSYGGRQTTMVAAAQPELVNGLLLLSYPLHPPKSPTQLRTSHFPNIRVPALFVHGAKDGFGSLEEMASALQLIPARSELLPVEGAGHELLARPNDGKLPIQIAREFVRFIEK